MRTYTLLLVFVLTIYGCDQNNDFISHNKHGWPYLKELPVEPDSVIWSSHDMSSNRALALGPIDHYIQAVLYYNDSTWQELLNNVDTSSSGSAIIHIDPEHFQEWFPRQVQSMFVFDGIRYVSDRPTFLLNPDHPWRIRCISGDKLLYLTYITN